MFLGPDGLMLRRGFAMDAPRTPETRGSDMEAVAHACRAHGKFSVIVTHAPEMIGLSLSLGFHMIVSGGDVPFLAAGSAEAAACVREIVAKHADG